MKRLTKFTYLVGKKKLTFSYYKNTQLKKVKESSTHPIYIQINFDKKTQNVPSILWRQLFEGLRGGISLSCRSYDDKLFEISSNDLDSFLMKDKDGFLLLCNYEFECIKRIIVLFCRSNPESVQNVVDAYQFWGQDGLRDAATNLLEDLCKESPVEKQEKKEGVKSINFTFSTYTGLSSNARKIIKDLLESGEDPVSIICFLDETRILSHLSQHLSDRTNEALTRILYIVNCLVVDSFYSLDFKSFTPEGWDFSKGLPFGVYFFPKIHFYYPISTDQSTAPPKQFELGDKIRAMDLLKLQGFITSTSWGKNPDM